MNMAEHVTNNQHNLHNQHNQHDQHNGNEVHSISQPSTMEGLYRMVRQLQDQNKKLSAQMVAMNRENSRRENKASYYQNNDDPIGDEEKNNTHSTRQKEKTFKTITTQGPSIYMGPFSEFNMSMTFPENFKLLTILKPYNGTRDP